MCLYVELNNRPFFKNAVVVIRPTSGQSSIDHDNMILNSFAYMLESYLAGFGSPFSWQEVWQLVKRLCKICVRFDCLSCNSIKFQQISFCHDNWGSQEQSKAAFSNFK